MRVAFAVNRNVLPGLAALLLLAGCEVEGVFQETDWGLNRMIAQPKYDAYQPNPFFDDQRAMRPPPEGTVHRDQIVGQPQVTTGFDRGQPVNRIPVAVDQKLLERGRDRFDIFCAVCHGADGSGDSVVARNMSLVRPPSLHSRRVLGLAPGQVYRVISHGYGVMPDYANQLNVRDRWAVVAYLRALQLSRGAPLDELPADVRTEAEENLR